MQAECRSIFCRKTVAFNPLSGAITDLNCKSWRCEKCRKKWGWRWRNIIAKQLKITPISLLLNLTTAEMTDNVAIEAALRYFFRKARKYLGRIEYVKVVEYNKSHTQPHFHFLLYLPDYHIPPKPDNWEKHLSFPENTFYLLKELWTEALAFAVPENKPTTVIWLQPPDNGEAASYYAVGYIVGDNEGKDEEPDATWEGRKLTYSRKFFYKPTAEIWLDILEEKFGKPDFQPKLLIPADIDDYLTDRNWEHYPQKVRRDYATYLDLKRKLSLAQNKDDIIAKEFDYCLLPLFPTFRFVLFADKKAFLERKRLRC